MAEQSTWSPVWKVNAAFLRAAFCAFFAWGFWELSAGHGFEMLVYMAALFAIAGGKHGVTAIVGIIRLILRQRAWAKYQRKGATPKADRTAVEADLKRHGLTK